MAQHYRKSNIAYGICDRCGETFAKTAKSVPYRFCSRECAKVPLAERFYANVPTTVQDGCVLWTGKTRQDGYGEIQHNKKIWKAHRMAWLIYTGQDPGDNEVCHTCDNPTCVRQSHLFLGTHSDNMKDMVSKGRHVIPRCKGEEHYASKLNDETVRSIRADGRPQSEIARDYGVNQSSISMVKRRIIWKHVI